MLTSISSMLIYGNQVCTDSVIVSTNLFSNSSSIGSNNKSCKPLPKLGCKALSPFLVVVGF